jgi:ATP synthase F1 gamma subunit
MRLIAMSTHARLRVKKAASTTYTQALEQVAFSQIAALARLPHTNAHYFIIISAQKGLCGPFNSLFEQFLNRQLPSLTYSNARVICIGGAAQLYAKERALAVTALYENVTSASVPRLCLELRDFLLAEQPEAITVLSMHPTSFFIQTPAASNLLHHSSAFRTPQDGLEALEMEESASEALSKVQNLLVAAKLQTFLYDSLLAEQSARFLSMDGATRNAQSLLAAMERDYNKLRQTLITSELTDLVAALKGA